MNIDKVTVDAGYTGRATATETPTPLVQPGFAPQQLSKGVTVKLDSGGPVYVGFTGQAESGYKLDVVGERIFLPVSVPSTVMIDGVGTVSWAGA
jgi:hypothetical protein